MKSKRIIAILVAISVVAGGFAACTSKEHIATNGEIVTEIVTNEKGEAVTDANGEVVTEQVVVEVVTNEKGEVVTDAKGNAVTKHNPTTTKPNGSTTTTKPSTTANAGTTTTAPASTLDEGDIVLQKNSKAAYKGNGISLSNGVLTITKGGDYEISQEKDVDTWHGQIVVKLANTEEAEIKFVNVDISNTTNNIIQIIDTSINENRDFLDREYTLDSLEDDKIGAVAANDSAPDVAISFPEGTSSSFNTSSNSVTGVLYNEAKLLIKGNGTANFSVSKNTNNCICSTKSITMKNATVNLRTASYDVPSSIATGKGSAKGIYSYSRFTVESGTLDVRSNGDGIRCEKFVQEGGTVNVTSSACDGIDTDDAIIIRGGSATSIALKKSSFKVRRVNNTAKAVGTGMVRAGKNDCFQINGGTVIGEGAKVSSLLPEHQSDKTGSTQTNITAKIVKGAAEGKTPAQIRVRGSGFDKTSSNKVTKYLYSSSSLSTGNSYTALAVGGNTATVKFTGKSGVATIETTAKA